MSLLVAVDIGHDSIKLICLKKRSKNFVIDKAIYVPYSEVPALSTKFSLDVLSQAVKWIFSKHNIKNAKVVFSISSSDVYTKYLLLPPSSKEQLDKILFFEVQQDIPFPLEEVTWDYHLIGVHSLNENSSVVFHAIKNTVLDPIVDGIEESSCSLEKVDVGTMALYNLAVYNKMIPGSIIVDLGREQTTVLIIDEQNFWSRTFAIGSLKLINVLAEWMGVEPIVAERFQKKVGMQGEGSDLQRSNVLLKEFSHILKEVEKIKDHYTSSHSSFVVKDLYLTGGLSNLLGSVELFEKYFGIQTHILDPFKKIDIASALDYKNLQELRFFFGTAVGLCLGAQKKALVPIAMNLLPQGVYTNRYRHRLTHRFFLVSAFLLIFFSTFLYKSREHIRRLKFLEHSAQNQIVSLKKKTQKLADIQKKIQPIEKELSFLSQFLQRKLSIFHHIFNLKKITMNDCHYTMIQYGFLEDEKKLLQSLCHQYEHSNIDRSKVLDTDHQRDIFVLNPSEWLLQGVTYDSLKKLDSLRSGLESDPYVERCVFESVEEKLEQNERIISFSLRMFTRDINES